jgi:thiosulfate reductase cytochrome b subunit
LRGHIPTTDAGRPIHPAWLRATHWLNALAVAILAMSEWRIYNDAPFFGFKLGHKNPKHIQAIFVTNTYPGGYWEDQGYNWFGGS